MPIRTAIFDFDLTLSVEHVFNLLSAGPPPVASSEAGQLARIAELEQRQEYVLHGGFATVVMGGAPRIAHLNEMLSMLRSSGIECLVCTKGLVGPVRKILDHVGLLSHFSGVYGNTGDAYGVSDYDRTADAGADACFLGGPDCQVPATKQRFVQGYMDMCRLTFDEVLFIDDTMDEVTSMSETCQTIHVSTRGMDPQILADVCRLGLVPPTPSGPQLVDLLNRLEAEPLPYRPPPQDNQLWSDEGLEKKNRQEPAERVEVWSRSNNAWCHGVVIGKDGPMLHVEFQKDGQIFTKAMPEGCDELRFYDKLPEAVGIERRGRPKQGYFTGSSRTDGGTNLIEVDSDEDAEICHLDGLSVEKRRRRTGPCCTQ